MEVSSKNRRGDRSGRRPRLVFINRSYWPDTEATGQLLTELCEGLAREFDVQVVAGRPNHVEHGQSDAGPGRSRHNRVRISRVWHTRFPKQWLLGRAANLLSFTLAVSLRTLWMRRPDVVITETDPFLLPLLGRWLQRRYRCPWVAYLQDIYPDVAIAVGKIRNGPLARTLRAALVRAYRKADRVVVLNKDMRSLCRKHGVAKDRLRIVPNWADTAAIQPVDRGENQFRREHGLDGRFVAMYSGNMGLAHLLEPILDAAELLREREDIAFVMIGEGVQRAALEESVRRRGLSNVQFHSYQPRRRLSHSLGAADVHLVSMKPQVQHCLMPSKVYGILAAAKPMVAICPTDCEMARLVRDHELGFICDAEQPETAGERVAFAIQFLADRPAETIRKGDNGRRIAESEFDRKIQVERFRRLLGGVLGGDEPAEALSPDAAKPVENESTPAAATRCLVR